jgi:hypothetical protein
LTLRQFIHISNLTRQIRGHVVADLSGLSGLGFGRRE